MVGYRTKAVSTFYNFLEMYVLQMLHEAIEVGLMTIGNGYKGASVTSHKTMMLRFHES